ncbi:prepilin-type N-terminal cleavage/methylation domain-containing protein [Moorellaceae bacterium AZ2]
MRSKRAGFTLVEVVVAVTIFVLALSAALALYVRGTQMFRGEEIRVEVQENARVALDRMVRELRTAREINGVSATSITFTLEDGSQVRYYHDTSRQQLMRQKDGGVNPVASYIKDLRFTDDPPGATRDVLIRITLVAGRGEDKASTFTTSVFVR